MADEDNFDIDIYGDGEGMDEDSKEFYKKENERTVAWREQQQTEQRRATQDQQAASTSSVPADSSRKQDLLSKTHSEASSKPRHGVKRKGDSDERVTDAGATNALMISDLHWWTTEDDIRGWVNEADAEDELKDMTFSEHKVNGKSKGQVFIEFTSPQASTATKRKIESLSSGPKNPRKFSVVFTNSNPNPFKTLPKDAPARTKDDRSQRSTSTSYTAAPHHVNYIPGNYRGRGGGFNHRGGYSQNYNNRGSFSGPNNMGGYNNGPTFQGNMPMMNNFNTFGGRGGVMGVNMHGNMNAMRGRDGMTNNNMMPMGMMGMGMGMGMGMNMNMNPMMTGMGPGFGGTGPGFNAPIFNPGRGPGMNSGDWGHGAKRQRQD